MTKVAVQWLTISVASFLFLMPPAPANLAIAQQFAEPGTHTPVSAMAALSANHYKYKPLYDFCGSDNCPYNPNGDLIFDAAGNLYGTTFQGGDFGAGVAFQLSPQSDGTWKHTTLFEFNGKDQGGNPRAGLAMDAAGNLYGTTTEDGAFGEGTVFELSPSGDGTWKLATILTFNGKNGAVPQAHLILDAAGNLYGTTTAGGDPACDGNGCGTVFELSPIANGTWKHTVLLKFDVKNGVGSYAPLIFDAAGNLYGTAAGGGKFNDGLVFELSPQSNGVWRQTTLFTFDGTDGSLPLGGLVFDAAGNLYGTTANGGRFNTGTVFELSPQDKGSWKHTTLLAFHLANGSFPAAGLIFDPAGNLYGNAQDGHFGEGIVFQLSPQGNGKWK